MFGVMLIIGLLISMGKSGILTSQKHWRTTHLIVICIVLIIWIDSPNKNLYNDRYFQLLDENLPFLNCCEHIIENTVGIFP